MNPLQELPEVRKYVYRAFWVAGLALGATQVWFATVSDDSSPGWLVGAAAVLGYLSIATNYTADKNVGPTTYTAEHVSPTQKEE